jgi:VanZ family protein
MQLSSARALMTAGGKIDQNSGRAGYGRLVGILCLCVLGSMLVAGLWPFCAPGNRVQWLRAGNGLQFASNSSVVSTAAFHSKSSAADTPESIEIWFVPGSSASMRTILGFGNSDHPGAGFALRQHKDMLFVQQYYVDKNGAPAAEWLPAGRVLAEGKPLFLSISMGSLGTSIYIDGELCRAFARRGISMNNLSGRLVVADGAEGRSSWPGQVLGLAMYGSQLTPSQVAENYASWTKGQPPVIREDEAPTALFTFDERQGNVVHNRVDSTNNLIIPDHYFALDPLFLASVRRDYQPTWDYWHDIGVNIAGFIPCGFLFTVLLSEVCIVSYPALKAISIGLLISLTIEVLQAFLPTRSSGITDLITNTLGTGVGVAVYYWRPAQSLLGEVRRWFGIGLATAGAGKSFAVDETSAAMVASSEERLSA